MRIALLAVGTRGDVQPYIGLGAGLKAAGHDVRLVSHADFEAVARQKELDFAPISGPFKKMLETDAGQAWLDSGRNLFQFMTGYVKLFRPVLRKMLEAAWDACQDVDAVFYSTLALGGHDIAEKLRIPCYSIHLQPWSRTRVFSMFPLPGWLPTIEAYNMLSYIVGEQVFWQPFRRTLNEFRREVLDLEPLPLYGPHEKLHRDRVPFFYGYSPSVVPRPDDWPNWLHVTGYWFMPRQDSWQPPEDLVEFLESGPPPVYIGFGSMRSSDPRALTRKVVEALDLTGQRGILLTGWGGLDGDDLPDHVFRIDAVPHDWLFPKMAAVVHHGGAGTTATALRAGVPSIITPFFADQFFWASRVAELGVAPDPIPLKSLDAPQLAKAIHNAVREPAMRQRAEVLGRQIHREDGVARAVELFHYSTMVH